ncbi:MAG: single-stranded-DNA-specific exonuclease RecJ [Deltaproteobacteria bacterium]|nr:single-stranded-DNA-specific exonuclease RecJ [Deltaproteobacteria bacterium]
MHTRPSPVWQLQSADPQAVARLVAAGIDPLVAQLLVQRDMLEPLLAQAFLTPALRDLPDPFLMADAQRAAELIADAMQLGHKICVYGDYDVDGVTAAALLHDVFGKLDFPVQIFLPDRLRDGYGLHGERLSELVAQGVQLFIAVDCGSTALAEIAQTRAAGCEFVVVDHHTLGSTWPNASALLNPKRHDCAYPDKHLSAVGVALVLAQALRRVLAGRQWPGAAGLDMGDLVELAALGTIADVVELRHVNRTLAWHGLRRLGKTGRLGLRALAKKLPLDGVDAHRVGFHLGPKINAAGRIADARTAFELLTESDALRAEDLALRLDLHNNHRQDLTAAALEQALAQAHSHETSKDCVVVAGLGWHPGVVGIVAGRLREQFGVPAFALALDEDGLARGSGRSVAGLDLVAALQAIESESPSILKRFGGHAFAAGVTLASTHVEALRQRLADHVARVLPLSERGEVYRIDAELAVEQANLATLQQIEQLEPFGKGNPAPLFLLRGVEVQGAQVVGKTRAYQRAKLHSPGRQPAWARPAVAAFAGVDAWAGAKSGDHIDAVIKLQRNHFQGTTTVQADVLAVRPA